MEELLADPARSEALIATYGSPLNLINPRPLLRNAAELVDTGRALGVNVKIRFARKTNKSLALVQAAFDAGHGVDVASYEELRQVLQLGMPGERVIVTAAVKPDDLLRLAVHSGATISLDTVDECAAVIAWARRLGRVASVTPRVAADPALGLPPTRFGELARRWRSILSATPNPAMNVTGIHLHLAGYDPDERAMAVTECLALCDDLAAGGHRPAFIDIGGGIPVNYLIDEQEWRTYWQAIEVADDESLTWRNQVPRHTYPFFQRHTRTTWLTELLNHTLPTGRSLAKELQLRALDLQLEPGRALADGCGITLARVAFVKRRSDGIPLVGLQMNRTQCRSTSEDFLVDPILVSSKPPREPLTGFLVGAYCIEDDLILSRRIQFPLGIQTGDIIALINTAGYLMHILESSSHQLPLARNLVIDNGLLALDPIDNETPTHASWR